MQKFDRDINVQGTVVTTSIQSSILEEMRPAPFTANDLELKVAALGFSEKDSLSMRIADRLIQKYKKHGHLIYGADRKWRVLPAN